MSDEESKSQSSRNKSPVPRIVLPEGSPSIEIDEYEDDVDKALDTF